MRKHIGHFIANFQRRLLLNEKVKEVGLLKLVCICQPHEQKKNKNGSF